MEFQRSMEFATYGPLEALCGAASVHHPQPATASRARGLMAERQGRNTANESKLKKNSIHKRLLMCSLSQKGGACGLTPQAFHSHASRPRRRLRGQKERGNARAATSRACAFSPRASRLSHRRHCHPQGLVELGQLLNCWDHSRRWCRRRRAPPQLSAPSTDPATSPPALLLKLRCPQWRSLACSRAARCACLSPSAALYHAASSLPCLTSQGEGVARSRLKAHDVRSFHPGQASSAGSPNADQPSTPPAAAAAHPLATISLRRPRGVR